MKVAIVPPDTFEFDSRGRNTAYSLTADGHEVVVLALPGEGLPATEILGSRVRVVRLDIDRRITSGLRPLPVKARVLVARAIGLDPQATILPAAPPRGVDRLRHPVRRLLELCAHVRRVGPWTDAVVAAAPGTDVFHTETLPALPVVRGAARRVGGRYVYDVADYQTEAARIARLPRLLRALLRRRERHWARGAVGLLAVSEPVATLVADRFGVPKPGLLLNCPPAWRPDEIAPVSNLIREALGLPLHRPVIVHQGHFKLDRGIEELVGAAGHPLIRKLDAAIVFIGTGRLRALLDQAAAQRPGQIFVIPAVPPERIVEWVASADVVYLGFPPRTLNLRLTLPNKLFESMMAGVPVIADTATEQGRFVERAALGRTTNTESADALAEALYDVLSMSADEREAMRRHCRSTALSRYTWQLNHGPLIDLYRRIADLQGADEDAAARARATA